MPNLAPDQMFREFAEGQRGIVQKTRETGPPYLPKGCRITSFFHLARVAARLTVTQRLQSYLQLTKNSQNSIDASSRRPRTRARRARQGRDRVYQSTRESQMCVALCSGSTRSSGKTNNTARGNAQNCRGEPQGRAAVSEREKEANGNRRRSSSTACLPFLHRLDCLRACTMEQFVFPGSGREGVSRKRET